MKSLLLGLMTLAALGANAKQSRADIEKCAERIQDECKISNNNVDRIKSNGVACKQVQGFGEKMEAVVLESGDVTIVQVSNNCAVTKFDLGAGLGIEDLKVIQGRAYMSTDKGAAYYFRANANGAPVFYEVLKANKQSYSGVDTFKGNSNGTGVFFLDNNKQPLTIVDGQQEVNADEIEALSSKGRLRQIQFIYGTTNQSLFRN